MRFIGRVAAGLTRNFIDRSVKGVTEIVKREISNYALCKRIRSQVSNNDQLGKDYDHTDLVYNVTSPYSLAVFIAAYGVAFDWFGCQCLFIKY